MARASSPGPSAGRPRRSSAPGGSRGQQDKAKAEAKKKAEAKARAKDEAERAVAGAKAEAEGAAKQAKAEAERAAKQAVAGAKAEAERAAKRAVAEGERSTKKAVAKADAPTRGSEGATGKGGVERLVAKLEDSLSEKVEHHERAAERAAKKAQKHERVAERSAMKAAMIDHLTDHLTALDVWTRRDAATRKPRFSREEIAATAVRIADEEGFDALSMRHLASELGAGTMTLYHYVRNRDELLSLVTDTVMGEVVLSVDEDMPRDWRAALRLIAHRSLAAMQRHPWFMDIADDPPLGPNSVRHFDQTLEAVSSLPVSLAEKLDVVAGVDEYVFGYCLQERNNLQTDDGATVPRDLVRYVGSLLDTGEYPQLAQLADELGLDGAWRAISENLRDPGRFDRNLERLLDGIEAGLHRS